MDYTSEPYSPTNPPSPESLWAFFTSAGVAHMEHLTFLIHHLRAFAHTDYQARYWDQVARNELWLAALNHMLNKK